MKGGVRTNGEKRRQRGVNNKITDKKYHNESTWDKSTMRNFGYSKGTSTQGELQILRYIVLQKNWIMGAHSLGDHLGCIHT